MRSIYTDTITGAVYFCGPSSINNDLLVDDCGISVYYQGQWDTLGIFNDAPFDIIRWHDTLVVCGSFTQINDEPVPRCAFYDSIGWHPYGDFAPGENPRFLSIIDNELYALGAFTYADGHLCRGIAKRSGSQWISVGVEGFTVDLGFYNNFYSVVKVNGNLVASGHVNFEGTDAHGIGIQENGVWQPLGPGIVGSFGNGMPVTIFQDELYVGGAIHVDEGNPGEGIMKWTGSEFVAVGTGLQDQNNEFAVNLGIYDFEVHNGLLYVSGVFWHAGNVPAYGVATWDGTNWCGLGGEPDMPIFNIEFLGDTLFASPFLNYEGENVNSGLRYIGNYPDTCTNVTTGLSIPPPTRADLQITAEQGMLSVQLSPSLKPRALVVWDATGRKIISAVVGSSPVRIQCLSGVYLIQAEGFEPRRVVVP